MKNRRPIDDELDLLNEKSMRLIDLIEADPMGSYTGRPLQQWEMPVQDADDL